MYKIYVSTLFVLLMGGGTAYSQQKYDSMNQNGKGHRSAKNITKFNAKPAMVKGTLEEVVFGTEPSFTIKRILEVALLPLHFDGTNYYFEDGDFYIYNGGRYLLIAPPHGIKIKNLRQYISTLEQVGESAYYGKGIFYSLMGSEFEVMPPPNDAIIYNLPALTDVVSIDDEAYYEYLGVLYKKVFVNGEQAFEVVGELVE